MKNGVKESREEYNGIVWREGDIKWRETERRKIMKGEEKWGGK